MLDSSSPSRNLIVCCDGTNNRFGSENTNVVRLVQVASRDEAVQSVYYDLGVGTLPLPGFIPRVGQRVSEIAGLAFRAGLLTKVGDAYRSLIDTHQSGDRVFLVEFSGGGRTPSGCSPGFCTFMGCFHEAAKTCLPSPRSALPKRSQGPRQQLAFRLTESLWRIKIAHGPFVRVR